MRDKRPVDELSIEELERILAIRKREERMARLRRYEGNGRRVIDASEPDIDDAISMQLAASSPVLPKQPESAKPAKPTAPSKVDEVYFEGDPRFEDEFSTGRPSDEKTGRRTWNRFLLVVEVAATLGLVVLLFNVFQSLQSITQASSNLQAEYQATFNAGLIKPTATPIINVRNVVLPGGHTYNSNINLVSFNYDEVPAEYRDQYKVLINQPIIRPTAIPDGPIRIRIPRINVDNVVVYGEDWDALKLGVGHRPDTANPGQPGKMVLTAHDDVFGEIFKDLDKLQPNDEIIVSTASGKDYHYVVSAQTDSQGKVRGNQIVKPTDGWVLDPPRDGSKMLALVSCYPYRQDYERIIVFATYTG